MQMLPYKVEGSMKGPISMKIMQIIQHGPCSHQILTPVRRAKTTISTIIKMPNGRISFEVCTGVNPSCRVSKNLYLRALKYPTAS